MDFKNPRTNIIIRVILLTLTILIFAGSLSGSSYAITQVFFVLLAAFQVYSLIKYLEKRNEELVNFLRSIEFDDFSFNYTEEQPNDNVSKLKKEFNKIFRKFRDLNKANDDEFQYMKNIVQHVGIGLITFDEKGNVQIINTAAKKLLKISSLENIESLRDLSPALVESFNRLRTGGRDLVRLEIGGDIIQLAIYAIQLTLRGEEFKLVSIQNIQSELEEKEMEAWQNLVRVLTHEIMNSITPITSLANTVEEELGAHDSQDETVNIPLEDLSDIKMAIATIKKRSAGLIRFVQDFRNLTHIPQPKIDEISVKPFLKEIITLLKKDIEKAGISMSMNVEPSNMVIHADKELVSQVMINLVKNATEAFDEQVIRKVEIRAFFGEKAVPTITVRDNGCGIEGEALEKIFIPFFTTKKSGSGIGLSLSRQIMRQHKGTLGVKTKLEEGTEFILKF